MATEPRDPENPASDSFGTGAEQEDAQLRAELSKVERNVIRHIDPDVGVLVIAIAGLVLIFAQVLPWVGSAAGWEVILGQAEGGPLPRFFAATSALFGVLLSAVALMVRRWGLVWCCAILCGISCFEGLIAIWSRQTSHSAGPGPGLILAMIAMIVIAASWFRYAWSRP